MDDEGRADMGPKTATDEGEGSGDSCKSAGPSNKASSRSALAVVGEKVRKLHNGEPEHVSSDEGSVVEENAANFDNDNIEKESLDSEEEDFKLHVDVDVSSDQEGSDADNVEDHRNKRNLSDCEGTSDEPACILSQKARVNSVEDENEIIELSAGEDDDCEVLEVKTKDKNDDQNGNRQEEARERKKNDSMEIVDLEDSAELDLEIDRNSGTIDKEMEEIEDAVLAVEDDRNVEENEMEASAADVNDDVEMEETEDGKRSEGTGKKNTDHDSEVEEVLDEKIEGKLEDAGELGENSPENDINEKDTSETEKQGSGKSERVVDAGAEKGEGLRQDSAEVDDPRTTVSDAGDQSGWGGNASDGELSDSEDFIGFGPSEVVHSFFKEFCQVSGSEINVADVIGTVHISADSLFFTPERGEGLPPTSGSEAGDSSRFSPAPTDSSRCNSPSMGSVSGERRSGRKRLSLDINNPIYMKPFELGWKRELVYRSSFDSSNRRMADVYYYTPNNRKVRSAREILEYVDGIELTTKNFLFTKEPMGLDSSKETIRDARKTLNIRDEKEEEEEVVPPPAPKKSMEKQKSPKVAETAPTPVAPKSPLGQASNSSPAAVQRKAAAAAAQTAATPAAGSTSTTSRSFPRIKVTPTRLQKDGAGAGVGSAPVGKASAAAKRTQLRPLLPKPREEPSEDLEMGMLPPLWSSKPSPKKATVSTTWSSTPKGKERGRKRSVSVDEGPPCKQVCTEEHVRQRVHPMQNFMHDVCVVYNVFQHVFQYLKVQELLRAARVCRLWRDLAQHHSLWSTVHMKNSKVSDWEGLANTLRARRTTHLDLRKMLLPQHADEVALMWEQFCLMIGRIDCLERLDLCRCPASVVQHVLTACPNLRTINATAISCNSISLHDAGNLRHLEELRLKSLSGITLETSLGVLSKLSNLKHLALTTFRNLGQQDVDVIGSLENLELLELGEVNNLPASFPSESLSKLSKLRRLRLEKVQGLDALTFNYLETARSLPQLTQLELVNFDVKPGFDTILASCTNIRKLLIIPTYVTQSATTNRMVLGGVLQLAATLQQFVWGVTHELLRVTELFVDQCDVDQLKKEQLKKGDCIPVLKPVPGIAAVHSPSDSWSCEEKYGGPTPSVEILSLPKLHKLLNLQLPTTKVKLLKIPFHATWRQYLSDMHT